MSEKKDIEIQCAEKGCTEVRIFTVRDQEFYQRKGFTPPKRCKFHSQQRRQAHLAKEEEGQQEQRDNWQGEDRQSDASMLGEES